MKPDYYYDIVLNAIPRIGPQTIKILLKYFENAEQILAASTQELVQIPKIGPKVALLLKSKPDEKQINAELDFIQKNDIEVIAYHHQNYPFRLKQCIDAPYLMYYKGNANLAKKKIIGIVGSRIATEYGKSFIKNLIKELAPFDPLIISGLAYGIDITAHQEALNNQLETIGVIAHGLDLIYPKSHTSIAKEMINQGGLLTEYGIGLRPEKGFFPARNRIIAGLCEAIVVVEARLGGGALITADIANSYDREVFALPGRIYDTQSMGCNQLIKSNYAHLINSAEDLINALAWDEPITKRVIQTNLLADLSPFEQSIIIQLQNIPIQIDDLMLQLNCSTADLSISLTNLEIKGLIGYLPGKIVRALNN